MTKPAWYDDFVRRSEETRQALSACFWPKEDLDKTFWDVVYYRHSFLNENNPDFEECVVATKSDTHVYQFPIKCHLGIDWCARVPAETEEEAIENFWKACDRFHDNLY